MVVSIILFGFLSRRGFDSPHLHRVTIVQIKVSGVVTIYPDWGDPIEKKDDEIIVPYHKDMKRAELL